MAKWPSMHARLKGMKPHLPPKKDDGRPTLGKEGVQKNKKKTVQDAECWADDHSPLLSL
jgi:hypothetical protein